MPVMNLPDCAWCDTAESLSEVSLETEWRVYECSSCSKLTRVDAKNRAHRIEMRRDEMVRDAGPTAGN